jgi:hypothetical protein
MNVYVDYQINLLKDYNQSWASTTTTRLQWVSFTSSNQYTTLLNEQGFGPVFLCLKKRWRLLKSRTLFVANGWQFVNLPLT